MNTPSATNQQTTGAGTKSTAAKTVTKEEGNIHMESTNPSTTTTHTRPHTYYSNFESNFKMHLVADYVLDSPTGGLTLAYLLEFQDGPVRVSGILAYVGDADERDDNGNFIIEVHYPKYPFELMSMDPRVWPYIDTEAPLLVTNSLKARLEAFEEYKAEKARRQKATGDDLSPRQGDQVKQKKQSVRNPGKPKRRSNHA